MNFISERYHEIRHELLNRGFDIQDYSDNGNDVGSEYMKGHCFNGDEKKILVERIRNRIMNSSKICWHYYGKKISKDEAVRLLKML